MASNVFEAIVKYRLGKVPSQFSKQDVQIQVAANHKRDHLKTTFLAHAGEDLTPETIKALEKAADDYIDDVFVPDVYDLVEASISDDKRVTKTTRNESFKLQVAAPHGLKLKNNQPISAPNLAKLLNTILYVYVSKLMGRAADGKLGGGRYFKYQTGRFAHTMKVLGIDTESISSKFRGTSVYFSYLVSPYAVFEGDPRYSGKYATPTMLGKQAIQAAMLDTLHKDSIKSLYLSNFNTYINRSYK